MAADGTTGWRGPARMVLAGLALLCLFVVQARYGPLSAYVALGLMLLAFIASTREALARTLDEPGIRAGVAAFLLLLVAFSLSAEKPSDVLSAVNFAGLLLMIPTAMAMASLLHGRAGALRLFDIALAGAAINVAVGAYQFVVEGQGRVAGGFNPIYFGDLGMLFGFLAAGGWLFSTRRWRLLYAIGPLLGLASAGLGLARGAMVVGALLAVVFVVFAAMAWGRRRTAILAAVAMMIVAVTLVPISFAFPRAVHGLFDAWQQLTTGSGDRSTSERLEFYVGGWRAFLDSPLFGHGWSRRFSAAAPYMTAEANAGFDAQIFHLHNDIINIMSGAGLMGLGAYALLVLSPLLSAFRRGRESDLTVRYAAVVVAVGFAAMGLTDSVLVFELGKTEFMLLSAVVIGLCLRRAAPQA